MLDLADKPKSSTSTPRHLAPSTVALTSLTYFAASLAIIVAAAFALDRWIIPELENRGYLESHLWTDENHRLNHFTYLKNEARKDNPVWRSQYITVRPEHPGKKRILVVGDSFVWGDGSSNVNTLWWRQLDMELKRRGYGDVEVIAAGLNGASTRDELNWLSMLLPKYTPDLVIFGCVTNDPDEKDASGKPYVQMMPKELPSRESPISKLAGLLPNLAGQLEQISKLSRQAHLSQKSTALEYADWELALLKGQNFESYKKTVASLADSLKTAGVPAFVISLPAGFQNKTKENTAHGNNFFESVKAYNEERFSVVAPLFNSAGLLFVDTTDSFVKAAGNDPLLKSSASTLRLGINPGNGHPGAFSTHFYAMTAADTIERHFPALLNKSKPSGNVVINDCMPPYMNVHADKQSTGTFDFTYPPEVSEHTLYMPLRRRHVQLSLSEPADIHQIEITGENLSAAQIYPVYFDEKLGYTPDEYTTMPLKKGNSLTWQLDGKKLSAIKLRASFKGSNQALKIRFSN
ncbi:MAG TPA: SGNH/GDSL hydrolase family protein [Candidatus Melainabacteria bacterium]|nr:SGNH/GDSL hydrolase family protein [Candidatus Melainabacteria bacterium]